MYKSCIGGIVGKKNYLLIETQGLKNNINPFLNSDTPNIGKTNPRSSPSKKDTQQQRLYEYEYTMWSR